MCAPELVAIYNRIVSNGLGIDQSMRFEAVGSAWMVGAYPYPDSQRNEDMWVNRVLNEIRSAFGEEEELNPRFLIVGIAITVAFLIAFGVISYVIVFMFLGY